MMSRGANAGLAKLSTVGALAILTSQSSAEYSRRKRGDILQDGPLRLLGFPEAKISSSLGTRASRRAGERSGNGAPGDLLPVASGLFVAHQEILVVDAGQMERQLQPVDLPIATPDRCDRAFNRWRRWAGRPARR